MSNIRCFVPQRNKRALGVCVIFHTTLIPSANILFKTPSTESKVFRANSLFPLGSGTLDTWAMSPATTNNRVFPDGTLKVFPTSAAWKTLGKLKVKR